MVKSGLKKEIVENGEPARVSPYRLAAHLASAFLLYLVTLGAGIRILGDKSPLLLQGASSQKLLNRIKGSTHAVAGLAFATVMTGAFVAGLDAGMIYNSFPLMGDRIVPSDIWNRSLSWRNLTENPTTVQFIHRCMAISTVSAITGIWIASRRLQLPPTVRNAFNLILVTAWSQGTLGVLTLLYMVPIPLASAHQAGSLALLSSLIWLINTLKRTVH